MVALLVGRERDGWMVALLVGRERDGWMVVGCSLEDSCRARCLLEESWTAGWWRSLVGR